MSVIDIVVTFYNEIVTKCRNILKAFPEWLKPELCRQHGKYNHEEQLDYGVSVLQYTQEWCRAILVACPLITYS